MIRTFWIGVVGLVACVAGAQARWTYGDAYLWTRDAGVGAMSKQGEVYVIEHAGKQDWSLSGFPRIPVEAGDVFEMVCRIRISSDAEPVDAETGVILRDGKGNVLTWVYGGAKATGSNDWTDVKSRFIIPRQTASIEPRVIGHGKATVWIEGCGVTRSGTAMKSGSPEMRAETMLGNADLRISLDGTTGGFTVRDVRTGRVWSPSDDAGWLVLGVKVSDDKLAATVSLLEPETGTEMQAVFRVDERRPEVCVEISAEGPLAKPIDYPVPFATRKGDRLIVPMNEGVGLPVDEEHKGLWRLVAYGGHGICMGFFGVADDKAGDGWMCILETPDDAAMNPRKSALNGLWQVGPSWEATKGRFGYTRKARYVFFDKGGHVAMCKRYRDYAKQIGLFKPFTEKVKINPKIDLLIGAANIWNFDAGQDKLRLVSEMQALGMKRLLWSGAGSAEELAAMNAMPHVLTSRYDIYQDIMDPANFDKIQYRHGDWVTEAFPQDINWAGPNGFWRRGWQIEPKDGGEMIPCAVICDSKAVGYARKRISDELKTKPYAARFIDTTVAAPWFECYHPDHPMTRTESRRHKMELLRLVSEEFNLVCGSETGHEASVPFCDFFEGMLSLGPYRVADAGRNMWRVPTRPEHRVDDGLQQRGDRHRDRTGGAQPR